MTDGGLFRQEAVQHAADRRFGTVILIRPMGFQLICLGLAAAAVSIIVLLFTLSYQRKATVTGVVVPEEGLIRIEAAQLGVIASASVREGQVVQAGETLLMLSTDRTTTEHAGVARAVEKLLRVRRSSYEEDITRNRLQAKKRAEALTTRAEETKKQLSLIADQISQQKRRIELAELSVNRYEQLTSQNYVAQSQLQDKRGELLDQQQRLAEVERSASQLKREMITLSAEAADFSTQGQRDDEQLNRAIASVDQELLENETRRELVVRASSSGTVASIGVDAGQSVSPGQVLVTIIPSGSSLRAELYAPSHAAGFVRPGMEVLIRYQAYPYQKFGQHRGVVEAVTKAAIRPKESGSSALADQSVFVVRVKLDSHLVTAYGQAHELKPGMSLQASLMLEKRRLYEWILEPLYSVTGRM